MEYQSVGGAFSNAIEEVMAQREAKKRQAMLDNLTVQKAAREVDTEANRAEEHRQDLEERKREFDEQNRWKVEAAKKVEKQDVQKTIAALPIGATPDPDLVARAQKSNVPLPMQPPVPLATPTPGATGLGPNTYAGAPGQAQWLGRQAPAVRNQLEGEDYGYKMPTVPTEKPKVKVTYRDPVDGKNKEKWVSPEEAEQLGALESPTQPKPPGEGNAGHFTTTAQLDKNGVPIPGKFIKVNTHTGEVSPATVTGFGDELPITKAGPGAGQMAVREAAKKEVLPTLDIMDKLVDKAGSQLGPRAGRISDIELKIGDNDPTISQLAFAMKTIRQQYEAGLGGMRAASSALLIKQYEDLLSLKATPENLHGMTSIIRQILSGKAEDETTPKKKKLTPQEAADAYLKGK